MQSGNFLQPQTPRIKEVWFNWFLLDYLEIYLSKWVNKLEMSYYVVVFSKLTGDAISASVEKIDYWFAQLLKCMDYALQ